MQSKLLDSAGSRTPARQSSFGMLFADKEHLKTEIAVKLLRVREKELKYFERNLSTVGTQVQVPAL